MEGGQVTLAELAKASALPAMAIFLCGFRVALIWSAYKQARDERRRYESTLPIK